MSTTRPVEKIRKVQPVRAYPQLPYVFCATWQSEFECECTYIPQSSKIRCYTANIVFVVVVVVAAAVVVVNLFVVLTIVTTGC
jgi:hypothetical protein